MESFARICLICISAVTMSVTAQDPMYVATFSMAGASGNVTFTQGTGTDTTINVAMALPAGTFDWAVHERPILYDQRPACDAMFTGGALATGGDLSTAHGQLTGGTDLEVEFTNSQLELTGENSIAGRSLVLTNTATSTLICANILDFDTDVVTAVARFMRPFAGTVTFRQRQDSSSADTSVLVDLYDVIGPLEPTTYGWGIHSVMEYSVDMDLQERCSKTMPDVFNPTNGDTSSCQSDQSTCPIGDLSSKFGDITVNPVPTSRTQYFIDTGLPLGQNSNSVLGKNLVFTDNAGTFIACSPIQQLLPKTVSAKISVSGVNGTIEFTQRSPYDATLVSVNLANLQGLAGGYHVHKNPVTERITTEDQPASDANAGGHYNPFDVNPDGSPTEGTGTHDQYEVGDLSGKFGLLTSLNDYSAQHVDWNIQLFGKYSIVGRSIIIHKTEANARWAYGNIGYPTDVKTVRADFRHVVAGTIVFRQDPNDPYSDTTIFVDVIHADDSALSSNHNFHVHQTPIENDFASESSPCASAAAHFNPFADVDTDYDQCSFTYPLRCEVGDLSQKLATIDIPSASSSSNRYFFTDPLLPLTGVYSVSGRSVVIHTPDRGAPRYACANLYDVASMFIKTETWIGGPVVSGKISVLQASEFDQAEVEIHLSGLQEAGGWHIHLLPIDPDNSDAPCSDASVMGHFNPFGIVGSPATGTDDMYEVGDLSGKFGSLAGVQSISEVYMDSNLALSGPQSVAWRSIVIHRDDVDGTRMVCSDVVPMLAAEDFTIVARATFQEGPQGTVTLRQTRFASGYVGDTTMEVDVVDEGDNVEYRLAIPQGLTCATDNIYNPYGVSVQADQCSISRMRLCATGDLVSKHGVVYGNQRAVFTDVNLPLSGLNSVIGHHLAITMTNGETECSSITPDQSIGRRLTHAFPSTTAFDAYDFQTTVANAIADGNHWQVVPSEEPVQSSDIQGCSTVGFWVIGPNVDQLVTEFSAAVKEGNLASYNPTELCADGTGGGGGTVPSGPMIVLSTVLAISVIVSLQEDL